MLHRLELTQARQRIVNIAMAMSLVIVVLIAAWDMVAAEFGIRAGS